MGKTIPSMIFALILVIWRDPLTSDISGTEYLKSSQLWAALATSIGFMVAFRNGKAYGRFWDGTTLLHQMFGEWFDASSCLIAFSRLGKKTKSAQVADFRHTLIRLMSLCH